MTIHQQKSILKNQQLNRNESKWTRMAETRQKNRQNPWKTKPKHDQKSTKCEKNSTTNQQNSIITSYKRTKNNKKARTTDQQSYSGSKILFWTKISKQHDFQMFGYLGGIVWDKMMKNCIFLSDMICSA